MEPHKQLLAVVRPSDNSLVIRVEPVSLGVARRMFEGIGRELDHNRGRRMAELACHLLLKLLLLLKD